MDTRGSTIKKAEKTMKNNGCHFSRRERKMALLLDVQKLKRKLRYEENVRRALERAFSRPMGALPRLPPYLPPYILELLAEVAVLEEEVVRLEDQVVNFREGLYQESAKRNVENLGSTDQNAIRSTNHQRSKSLFPIEFHAATPSTPNTQPSLARCASSRRMSSSEAISDQSGKQMHRKRFSFSSVMEDWRGKENNLSCSNSVKDKQLQERKSPKLITLVQRLAAKPESPDKSCPDDLMVQLECRLLDQKRAQENSSTGGHLRISKERLRISSIGRYKNKQVNSSKAAGMVFT